MSRDNLEATRDPAQQLRQIRDETFRQLIMIREMVADNPGAAGRCADVVSGMLRDLRYVKGRFEEDADKGEAEVLV